MRICNLKKIRWIPGVEHASASICQNRRNISRISIETAAYFTARSERTIDGDSRIERSSISVLYTAGCCDHDIHNMESILWRLVCSMASIGNTFTKKYKKCVNDHHIIKTYATWLRMSEVYLYWYQLLYVLEHKSYIWKVNWTTVYDKVVNCAKHSKCWVAANAGYTMTYHHGLCNLWIFNNLHYVILEQFNLLSNPQLLDLPWCSVCVVLWWAVDCKWRDTWDSWFRLYSRFMRTTLYRKTS